MTDHTLTLLKQKFNDTYEIAPNHFNNRALDMLFIRITSQLKTFPFKWYIPLALIAAGVVYLFVGFALVRLASLLQYGF